MVFIEEAFERLLLDYDRVFSCMGIPACLWRRTGEIYKGNREFAELVGIDGYMLRDVGLCELIHSITLNPSSEQGRLCIYELMAEESAVNYWEVRTHSPVPRSPYSNYLRIEIRQRRVRLDAEGGFDFVRIAVQTHNHARRWCGNTRTYWLGYHSQRGGVHQLLLFIYPSTRYLGHPTYDCRQLHPVLTDTYHAPLGAMIHTHRLET